MGSLGMHPSLLSHPTKAARPALKKEVTGHGLDLSGIAVDPWSFKNRAPSATLPSPERLG